MSSIESLSGKTVCVVDAYGLIYQVFHAPGMEMTNSKGEPTGAAFGFVRDVLSIMTKLQPDYLFCAYDMHAPTFRSELYPEYKANRVATPDDLLLQFDFTREFLKGVGVPALSLVGYEADDVMATLARRVKELGGSTILATADKDARQLLDDSTSIFLLRKDKYYRASELMEDWGITPDQVVDFQALVGDSSDNVPGVPLIGPKVASELLAKYRTLEGVFEGAVGQKGKRFENIRNGHDLALLSRQLVTLRTDVPIEFDWESGKLGGIDPERLKRLFQYWNFRSFLGKIDGLVAKFGQAQAAQSDWFDKIEEERLALLAKTGAAEETAPSRSTSLFDALDAPKGTTAPKIEASGDGATEPASGAIDFARDVPLLARFKESQYGSQVADEPDETAPRHETFEDFELVGVRDFPSLDSIPLPNLQPVPRSEQLHTVVDDAAKLDALVAKLQNAQALAVAVVTMEQAELGRVQARRANLCGLALAFEPNEAFYLPFRAPLGAPRLERKSALDALRPFLESRKLAKIGFELKFDALVLLDSGVRLRGLALDVALLDHLTRAGETQRELSDLATTYLDASLFDLKSALGTGKKRVALDALPTETLAEVAADLTLTPLAVAPLLRVKTREVGALELLATELELPIVETLAEMEYNGIAIDPDRFRNASALLFKRQEALEHEIREIVAATEPDFAREINLNSPKQLQHLLFELLKLRVVKKTKTGPSVDAEVLEELAIEHPVPEKIVELRKLIKLRGTYLEPLPTQTIPATRRISATFHQAATATGRLSSSDPNLQNIPARSENGKLIRSGFVPDAALGFDSFVSCDYSQLELRVLAHFSGDPELQRAYREDADVHASVASRIFGVAPEDVTSDMRRKAKAVNFGLVYGQTAFGLSKALGIATGDANAYIDTFFETYPGVLSFFDRVLDDCAKRGYVQTLLGRRRALSGVRGARGRKTLNFPERAAINAVVQGTAADLMKLAMLAVWRRLKREGWIASRWSDDSTCVARPESTPRETFDEKELQDNPLFAALNTIEEDDRNDVDEAPTTSERARLLLQIHDELLFETKRADANQLAQIVRDEMTLGQPLSVPLKVDAEIGANLGDV